MSEAAPAFHRGERVRVIDLDVAGTVVEVIGEQDLVIVDLYDDVDRITVAPAGVEHLD